MTKRELKVILNGVRSAQNIIEALGFENYPYGMVKDHEIQDLYYSLNDMCILLDEKIQKTKD